MKIKEILNEVIKDQVWYHGTSDDRRFKEIGGFDDNTTRIEVIDDIDGFNRLRDNIEKAFETDKDTYFKLINNVQGFKGDYKYPSPIFLSNNYDVASTYTSRPNDFQGSTPNVMSFNVDSGYNAVVHADGVRFRFINVDKVKSGFMSAGISSEDFDRDLSSINFDLRDKTSMMTNMIAALGSFYKFDYIDIVNVLDSYDDGGPKSTVRMVLNKSLLHKIN